MKPEEIIARAMEPRIFSTFDKGYTTRNYFEETAFLNAEKVVKRTRKKVAAALTALHAAGYAIVPREPTRAMVRKGASVDGIDSIDGFGHDYPLDTHKKYV